MQNIIGRRMPSHSRRRAVAGPSQDHRTAGRGGTQHGTGDRMIKEKPFREDFPIFRNQPDLVYLDSAATSLKPQCVIDAMNEYYTEYSANVHRGLYELSEKATKAYEEARIIVKDFIGAASEKEIIFTRSATESLNVIAQGWGRQFLKSGDEIILTLLEHHSNIVPWQMVAKEKNCIIKFIPIDDRGTLKLDHLNKLLNRRTKIIAISHVSNALGTITPLKPLIQKAHAIGAKVAVDAAQSIPHLPLNVHYLDCDFLAFSGHKMCGPTGIGVLFAKEKILREMLPFFGGGNMISEVYQTHSKWNDLPWKFEAGTPPIASAIGLGRAMNYLQKIGMSTVQSHEQKLVALVLAELKKIPGIELFGPADSMEQSSIISFGIKGIHPHDVAAILNEGNIAIRAGHHCCMPLMEQLGIPATARASFYMYNTEEDVHRLLAGIKKVKKIFKQQC